MKIFIRASFFLLIFFFTNQLTAQKVPAIPNGKEFISKEARLAAFNSFAKENGLSIEYKTSSTRQTTKPVKAQKALEKYANAMVKLSVRDMVIGINNQLLKPEKYGLDDKQVKNLIQLKEYLVVLFNKGNKDLEKALLENHFITTLDKMIKEKLNINGHAPYANDDCEWQCVIICTDILDKPSCVNICEWLCS